MLVFALTLLGWCTASMVAGLVLGRVIALRKDEASDIAAPGEPPELTTQVYVGQVRKFWYERLGVGPR